MKKALSIFLAAIMIVGMVSMSTIEIFAEGSLTNLYDSSTGFAGIVGTDGTESANANHYTTPRSL